MMFMIKFPVKNKHLVLALVILCNYFSIMKVFILVVFALLLGFSKMKHFLIETKTGVRNNTKGTK